MNLKEIVEQLESCGYECEGGQLERNIAFIELKKMADAERDAEIDAQGGREYYEELPPEGR